MRGAPSGRRRPSPRRVAGGDRLSVAAPATPDRTLIVVPARWGSTRLPGKPLVPIAGVTLLERVVAVARTAAETAGDTAVVVATDDPRIAEHVHAIGGEVAMTDAAIASGSGRAFAAAMQRPERPGIVVNLQGDAPFVPPATVAGLVAAMRSGTARVATPVVRLDWPALDAMRAHKAAAPFSGTTCLRAGDGRALWFSKAVLPAIRDEAKRRAEGPLSPVYRHIGLYAYRLDALAAFEAAPPSRYERIEGLEQLRLIELGIDILTIEVAPPVHAMSGIDTAADVALAEALIAVHGDPFER